MGATQKKPKKVFYYQTMKNCISVVVIILLVSLLSANGHSSKEAKERESLSNVRLRNRGLRHRKLKKSKGKGKGSQDDKENRVEEPKNEGFDFPKQAKVYEKFECITFESDSAQWALNHPDTDGECLTNSCPNGCCRRSYGLVCDESDKLYQARCICNANTNNTHLGDGYIDGIVGNPNEGNNNMLAALDIISIEGLPP